MKKTAERSVPATPREEYTTRLAARSADLARHVRWERRIADARLLVFLLGGGFAWFVFATDRIGAGWIAIPIVLFVSLIVAHERVRRAAHRATRSVSFYEKGLARLEDRWAGTGVRGDRFLDPDHPYAADLDLFGPGSLFERLCTARTRAGEETLAAWLLGPASVETIGERHAAVVELRPRLDLREELELLGADVRAGIDPEALAAWGGEPRVFTGDAAAISAIAALLAGVAVISLFGWVARASPFYALGFLVALTSEMAFGLWVSKRVRRVLRALDERTHDLVLLSAVLECLERETFTSPGLRRLVGELETGGESASRRIARLARLLHLLDCQKNQLFMPIAAILLWSVQLALAIDGWRVRSGPAVARWLAAVGEFEALCALAGYSWECPADIFPEIAAEGAWFEAERVGHPLVPESKCVRNDLRLGGERRVLVVSGSNMSGKSTLLRTIGANTVLALAGAPVRAGRLRVARMAIGATLRIQDSLQAGRSRFFAEITRVRQLVDLSRAPLPLLFLLDEVFNGTNSDDRRVGAEAVVRGLLATGAIGLVTTHDLALTAIVDRLDGRGENVHFEDTFEDGTMHFDYRMRAGVVTHSNALALMRAVGLDV